MRITFFIIGLIFLSLSSISCSTIATRSEDGRTLTIKGMGKGVWEDGTSIEGKPVIQFPSLPPVEIDR